MDENAENTDGSDQRPLSTSTYDPSLELSDDGDDAFEAVVVDQPPSVPTVTVASSESASLTMSGGLTCEPKSKKGKMSLSRISQEIRGRLSRDARLARKFPAITGASPEREPHPKTDAGNEVSVSTDILASIASSDGGYDSDARNLLTPELAAQLGDNSCNIRASTKPADVLSAIEETQAPSQAPASQDSGGILARPSGPRISSMAFASTDDLTRYSSDVLQAPGSTSNTEKAKIGIGSFRYEDSWRYSDLSPTQRAKYEQEDNLNDPIKDGMMLRMPPSCPKERAAYDDELFAQLRRDCATDTPPRRTRSGSVYSDQGSQETNSSSWLFPVMKRRNSPSAATPSLEKIPEETKEENELHSTDVVKEAKLTKSSRPAQVLSIPRVRPRATTTENQEEERPELERPSPRVVQSRFIEDLDDVFVDKSPEVLANRSSNIQSKDETRKSSEGWLSGGKRLGYNYDFEGKAPSVPDQENIPREQYERVVSPAISEASRDLEGNPLCLETEPDIAAAEIHASTLKGPEHSSKKSAALIPRLSGFMRRKARQVSSADSDLADVMLSEARGIKTHKIDDSQTSGENEDEKAQGSKGRQFFKSWKNPLISSRRASNQMSPINRKAGHVEEFKETMPYEPEIETSGRFREEDANVASSLAFITHRYSESPPRLPLAPEQQAFSEDEFATDPRELPSAEDWSRMYEACVEYPTADDELGSVNSGGSNVAQYARTIRENQGGSGSSSVSNIAQYARTIRENHGGSGDSSVSTRAQYAQAPIPEDHVSSASLPESSTLDQYGRTINQIREGNSGSNSTELRQSTTEFRLAQLAAEAATREELLNMVNSTWV